MPSKLKTLTVRPDPELFKKMKDFASARGITMSAAINIALYETFSDNAGKAKEA